MSSKFQSFILCCAVFATGVLAWAMLARPSPATLSSLPSADLPRILKSNASPETQRLPSAESKNAAARDWELQKEPGEWRDGLMARVVYAGSQSNPAAAARMVADEIPQGLTQDEAAISVLHQWALSDPEAAASWATAFPSGALRTRALAEIEGISQHRILFNK